MNEAHDRPRRRLRTALFGFAGLVGLLIVAVAVFIATFNADTYKPRIVAAVKSATGRDIALNGPIRLAFSLHPTIEVHDVALANPAGFSRPDMARIQTVDVQLALLPLISRRIEIDRLVLVRPDILLETTKQGAVNWRFGPPSGTPTPQPQAPAQPAARGGFVSFANVSIQDGTIAYRDDRTGHLASVAVQRLDASAASPSSPLHLTAQASVNGLPLTVAADTGSLLALQAPQGGQAWPVKATVSAAGASLHADGAVTLPLLTSYAMTTQATVPDLAALTPLAPNARLPPLHDVAMSARISGSSGAIPAVSALTLHAGASDLSALVAGLKIIKLDVAAPSLDQPVHAELAGTYANQPLTATAALGAPNALLHGTATQPFPIDISANAAGGQMNVKGSIADPARLAGLDLHIDAHIAAFAALSQLTGRPLPALRDVAFQGRLTDPQGLTNGISLQSAKLTSAQGDVEGDIAALFRPRPSVRAQLTSQRIDADALRASVRQPPAASAHPLPTPAAQVPKQSPAPPRAGHLIPDTKLPFDGLRAFDADVTATVGTLITGGETWHGVAGHLVVQDGKLHLDPFKATLPAGQVELTAAADATRPSPPVSLRMQAPSVALKAVLAALGKPAYASGNIAISADLNGAGDSPHAIAASLDGTLSLAMQGGEIDTALLEKALGPVIARANPVGLLAKGGASQIRCLAARFTARNGIAMLDPFLLSSSLLTVDGSGRIDLASETLDLHLHPQGRVGGTQVTIPLTVTGPLADPHVAMNQTGAATKGFEAVIGAIAGKNNPLAGIAGPASPSCAAALASARGTAAPPAASGSAAAKPAPTPAPKLPNAGALLKQLFR